MSKSTALSSSVSIATLLGLLLFSLSRSAIASSECSHLTGCERKFCEIERQLKISKEQGNSHRTDGLTISLENARKNCSNKSLQEDLLEEIAEVQEDIAEHQADMKEAQAKGKTDKMEKYQRKISEKQSKLKQLEQELSELNRSL